MAAVNTAVSPLQGAPAAGAKLEVYQREINFATTNLAAGDWFDVFQLEAGDVVISGSVKVILAGTATTDVTVGADAGTTLCTGANLDGTAGTVTPFTNTTGVVLADNIVSVAVDTATAVLGIIQVTAIVLKAGDFSG